MMDAYLDKGFINPLPVWFKSVDLLGYNHCNVYKQHSYSHCFERQMVLITCDIIDALSSKTDYELFQFELIINLWSLCHV